MVDAVFVPPEESIAAGYDNTAGFDLITSLVVNDVPFTEVQSLARWNRGQPVVPPGTGVRKFGGYPFTSWLSSFITLEQFEFLKDTYEGEVTIRTLTFNAHTYSNWNVVLYIGELTEYTDRIFRHTIYGKGVSDFAWQFSRSVFIPDP